MYFHCVNVGVEIGDRNKHLLFYQLSRLQDCVLIGKYLTCSQRLRYAWPISSSTGGQSSERNLRRKAFTLAYSVTGSTRAISDVTFNGISSMLIGPSSTNDGEYCCKIEDSQCYKLVVSAVLDHIMFIRILALTDENINYLQH